MDNVPGPVPRRKKLEAVSISLRPDQFDALNYLAGEAQFDSFAKAVRMCVDQYFQQRVDMGNLPTEVAAKVRDGLANR